MCQCKLLENTLHRLARHSVAFRLPVLVGLCFTALTASADGQNPPPPTRQVNFAANVGMRLEPLSQCWPNVISKFEKASQDPRTRHQLYSINHGTELMCGWFIHNGTVQRFENKLLYMTSPSLTSHDLCKKIVMEGGGMFFALLKCFRIT